MRWPTLMAAVSAAACGGDGTGPGGRLSGDWTYTVTNLRLGSVSCNESGTVLHIDQNGGTFDGTYDGGTWICTGAGVNDTIPIGTGTVVDGRMAGDSVWFYLDDPNWYSFGGITDSTMSGTVNARFPVSGAPTVVAGSWSSKRQ